MKKWAGAIALFCLFVIFYIFKDLRFNEILGYLLRININYLLLAIIFCFLTFLIASLRVSYICKNFGKVKFGYLFLVVFAGSFLNVCTPGAGIGGEPVKSYFLGRKYKKPQSKFFWRILADKFFHLFVFAFFIVFSILFLLFYIKIPDNLKLVLELVLFSLLFVILVFFVVTFKKFKFDLWFLIRKIHRIWFIKKNFETAETFENYVRLKVKDFAVFFKSLLKDKKIVFLGVFYSLLCWFFFYAVSWILFLSFGTNVSFLSVLIVVTLASLAGELSISPGGIGVNEGSMILLYNIMGVNLSLAITVSLISRLIFYFFSLVIGGISLTYLKFNLNKQKS